MCDAPAVDVARKLRRDCRQVESAPPTSSQFPPVAELPSLGVEGDELLAEVGLDKAGSSHANRLSLGMARRAALARALCVEPEVLLLDEPFVSIDPPTARGLRELSAKLLVNRDILTLLVTHDLDEALLLADRVLFLGGAPTRLIADIMVDIDRDKRALSKLRIFREEMLKNHPLISSLL